MNDITIAQMCEEITAELQKNAELPDDKRKSISLMWGFPHLFEPYGNFNVHTMRSTATIYGIQFKAKCKQMHFKFNWYPYSDNRQCIVSVSPVNPEDGKLTISEIKERYEAAKKAKQDAEKRQMESNENKFLMLLADCNISLAKFYELKSAYGRLDYETQYKFKNESKGNAE